GQRSNSVGSPVRPIPASRPARGIPCPSSCPKVQPHCPQVQKALRALTVPLETLQVLKGHMMQDMRKGLSRQMHAQATMQMLPTFICSMPDGTGKQGSGLPPTAWVLGKACSLSPLAMPLQLFSFIAKCLRQFLAGFSSPQRRFPLGFVFPFSCKQTQLDKAELTSWSKGFKCTGVEGKDVVQLLQSAINKEELYVDVVALMNDTVGTMMTSSVEDKACEVAIIIDAGTNSCFMAEAQQVEMVEESSGRMCVNTEWGCFGDDTTLSGIMTTYDQRVDKESSNPGKKRFEKLVGSLYLGEIVRHVLVALAAEKAVFTGSNAGILRNKDVLKTHQVLEIIKFGEILESVTGLLAPECTITLLPSVDGTGRGAAIVTAVALRLADQRREVDQLLSPLRLSRSDLQRVQALMRQEMDLGLGKETNARSSVRMLPTYVRATPDGTERGEFLALDLGGTNFRVLVVRVAEDSIRMASEIYVIPTSIIQGTGVELFNHIVECIMDFQLKQDLMEQILPLGFTFSFPCQQLGLDKAVLLSWTKGFNASGCVGQDVVQLLRDAALRKQHFTLKVVAVVNDTVGTMMSCGYDDPKCEIGLIVGTGTNACYMEEMRNVGTVEGNEGRMCINMEWGAFGDNGCLDHIFTNFDQMVDEKTINPGKQRFEKLISGMYLGEIVRYILLAMVEKRVLFRGKPCPKLQTKDIFQTKFLSTIEIDGLALKKVLAILRDLDLHASFEDSVLVREVCQTVSLRAAQLCAAGMAAVVEKMRENRGLDQLIVTVGVDGTLYKMHPHFSQNLQQTLQVLAPKCSVTFLQSEDGSGKGAALVAAVACRKAGP
uniref:hexokinase n=1 Tax=Strigops habroptila TaxID=2489341 RepID=A0A672TG54_STRHB